MLRYRIYTTDKEYLNSFNGEQEAIKFALGWSKNNDANTCIYKGAMIGRNGKVKSMYAFTYKRDKEYRIYF